MSLSSITRENLYKMVWEKPVSTLSKETNIPEAEIRKHCQKNSIPLPPMGYWSKIKHGKEVKRTPLPVLKQNDNGINLNIDIIVNVDDYSVPFNDRLNYIKKDIESSKNLLLTIPKSLNNPHEIIQRTKAYYQNKSKHSRYNSSGEGIIPIDVSNGSMNRALIIMDYFIKLVIARGHEVEVHYGRTQTKMFTVHEEFGIREKYNLRKFDKYPYERREPTGILVFKAKPYYHKTWEDSKTKSLEEKIPVILAWFEASAREMKAHWDANARREKAEAEQKRIEQEAKQRIENEFKKFNTLIDEAERWHKAKILREYITYLESNNISNQDDFPQWLEWAKKKADWYDPLIKGEDKILGYFKSNSG